MLLIKNKETTQNHKTQITKVTWLNSNVLCCWGMISSYKRVKKWCHMSDDLNKLQDCVNFFPSFLFLDSSDWSWSEGEVIVKNIRKYIDIAMFDKEEFCIPWSKCIPFKVNCRFAASVFCDICGDIVESVDHLLVNCRFVDAFGEKFLIGVTL